jgi:predicted O-methyltransferase YrrM
MMIDQPQIATSTTVETLIETLLSQLHPSLCSAVKPRWEEYEELRGVINKHFQVPSTTCTAIMSRLLFALGSCSNPRSVVGAGTYVGYCVAWILGLAGPHRALVRADLLDVDAHANVIARANCQLLGFGEKMKIHDCSAHDFIKESRDPVDLLFIDIDCPVTAKLGYASILARFLPWLAPGALVVAHDPCVPRFRADFETFHAFARSTNKFHGPWVLPLDSCGISVLIKSSLPGVE